jgi:spermidine synthase
LVVSDTPIDWDFVRWLDVLQSYIIDGEREFSAEDRSVLDSITSPDKVREIIEECPQVLVRTEGKTLVTDDNMGTEWRYPIGLD